MRDTTRMKQIIVALLCILGSVLIVIYIVGLMYYNKHFYPGTKINGGIYSNADKDTVSNQLSMQSADYRLNVRGREPQTGENTELFVIAASDIDMVNSVEDSEIVDLLKKQKSWAWPFQIWNKDFEYTVLGNCLFDNPKLTSLIEKQDVFQKNKTKAPEDAYIEGYSETEKKYVIVPEVQGTLLEKDKATEVICDAIARMQTEVDLDASGCYASPAVTADSTALQSQLAEINRWLQTRIRYDWNGSEVLVTEELVKSWILFQDGRASIDKEAVNEFVTENAGANDTYKKTRVFHTLLGYDLTLPCGDFGWKTDCEAETDVLVELIKKGSVCDREPVYAHKAPVKGMNDIGSSYLEADMTHQHLYLFKKGEIVFESDFVSGNMSNGCRTPEGVFGLTYKTMNATLRGADYVTPVVYWMPFHGNYGLHDATWRDQFGGDIYLTDGSHGCLNLPLEKAAELYPQLTEGFPIICYYYPEGMLPQQTSENDEE